MAETYLSAAWLMGGHSFLGIFQQPVALGFLAISALSVYFSLRKHMRQSP
jgi:hypothetical protein